MRKSHTIIEIAKSAETVTNKYFIFDTLLVHGYSRRILSNHDSTDPLLYIPNEIILIIVNYWGYLCINCHRTTIQVANDYIFDDKLCQSLCRQWDATYSSILEFDWKVSVPQHNIKIIENYKSTLHPKWDIIYENNKMRFVHNFGNVVQNINELLKARSKEPGTIIELFQDDIEYLCVTARKIFMSQPMFLELEPPINIIGDIHGQYYDLLRIFQYGVGYPPDSNYLFLGNYVDYGQHGIETMCLLLAYKILYKETFFMLRGNHEYAIMNRAYGFYDECKRKYSARLWKKFTECFNCLPVAAIISDKIFCIHGGLSPELKSFDQIKRFGRPADIPDTGLLCDLLWAEPDDIVGWMESNKYSYLFGPDVVNSFCKKFSIDLICRGHQCVEDGYEFFAERKLVTIFSAPNWKGEYENSAAMMSVDESLKCSFTMFTPS